MLTNVIFEISVQNYIRFDHLYTCLKSGGANISYRTSLWWIYRVLKKTKSSKCAFCEINMNKNTTSTRPVSKLLRRILKNISLNAAMVLNQPRKHFEKCSRFSRFVKTCKNGYIAFWKETLQIFPRITYKLDFSIEINVSYLITFMA